MKNAYLQVLREAKLVNNAVEGLRDADLQLMFNESNAAGKGDAYDNKNALDREEWLGVLLGQMQTTLKDICRNSAADIAVAGESIHSLRGFVDNYCAQFALLGIQLLWSIRERFGAICLHLLWHGACRDTRNGPAAAVTS